MKGRRLDFADHRRELGENRFVYPVVSRRAQGLSIGVNLNPDKACNFDCPYCQVDRRVPARVREVDLEILEAEIDAMLGLAAGEIWRHPPFDTVDPALRRVADLAFSGDGEPTSSAALLPALEIVARLRDKHGLSELSPVLITNASLFHRAEVAYALDRLYTLGGEVWGKLDAGTQPFFEQVCGTRLSLDRIVTNLTLAASHPLVIQAMFHRWDGAAPPEVEIEAWGRRLVQIGSEGGRIRLVQVYTVARSPADARATALPVADLEGIAQCARSHGFSAEVYS